MAETFWLNVLLGSIQNSFFGPLSCQSPIFQMLCALLFVPALKVHICAHIDGIIQLAGLPLEFTNGTLRLICFLLYSFVFSPPVLPPSIREG